MLKDVEELSADRERYARLAKWAEALRNAFFSRSPYEGHPRPLTFDDILEKIQKRSAHEARFGSKSGRARPPWAPRSDISAAVSPSFPEDSSIGKLLRVHIYERTETGEIDPARAEFWAGMFSWRPFAAWADDAYYDVCAAKLWTLGMAIKWVECCGLSSPRSENPERAVLGHRMQTALEAVRREAPECITGSLEWRKNKENGHSLYARRFKGYEFVDQDSKQLLLKALRSGTISAVAAGGDKHKKIPSDIWASLSIVGRAGVEGGSHVIDATLAAKGIRDAPPHPFDLVYIDQSSLRKIFTINDEEYPQPKHLSEADLRRLLIAESRERKGARIPYRDAEKIVSQRNYKVSRALIRKLIAQLWPAQPGRPKKG